ncbi:hypothetical protein BTJ39_19045 [Izhakiella australiensis]|uniref:Toxin SymE-like domain-containing protein n=1 Tax=Izhakiella australiensis TaxID=1926881 RepID=A0A1S8YG72_9GAMM|nr:SymE family type I addiction module toxin [Izhakiella australiensis]OON38069.1 hypothetical protein BTJ39_19045 [Izhakiella australiensis]
MPGRQKPRQCSARNATPAPQTRLLHVGYLPNQGKGAAKPQIKLAGNWLAGFGFLPGKAVRVEAQAGRLVITLQEGQENTPPPSSHLTPYSCSVEILRFGRIIQHPLLVLS